MWGWSSRTEATDKICAECRRGIGPYEPVIVETGGLRWRTSLVWNPVLRETDVVTHTGCAPAHRRQPHLADAA
jgi:hypothetical protein